MLGEDDINAILGENFFQALNHSQSDALEDGFDYQALLTTWMNEAHSPELLEFKETIIDDIREKLSSLGVSILEFI